MASWKRRRDVVNARRRRRIPSAQAPDLLDANIEMMWFCYCWMSMALLESYYIAKCCYYVFGSYLQGPLVEGELGAVYAVIALGTQFMTMNPQEFASSKRDSHDSQFSNLVHLG